MKLFEQNMKLLIEKSNYGCDPVFCEDGLLSEAELRMLSAKKLISMEPAGDGQFYIVVEPSGLTYFDDKRKEKLDFWKNHVVKFFSGFVSGILVGVITTLLVSWLARQGTP